MSETRFIHPAVPGTRMLRFIAFLYGAMAYLTFLVTILYAIGFVSGLLVPKTIDAGMAPSVGGALVINLELISLFAIQHARWPASRSSGGGRSSCRSLSKAAPMSCSLA
jgi:hypothetical protein